MYIVDNIINIVAMFVIDTSAKTLTITLAQSAVVKVRFNIDEIYSSTGASHVINLPIKDGMIATGAYVAIIDGVETLLPYSYPTEEPNIVWDENGLLSTMAVGDNTAYLGTIVSQSIVCTPPAPLVEKTGTSSVSYDPNIYSGTWSVRRTLELYYDQGNGLTTKKSIDVTDSHIVYNTNVQALYDAVSVFIQNYIDGCSLCKDSSVFMKLNGYMELFNGYWLNGSYEKAYDAIYEAGKLVNLSSTTVEIEPMMNGIAVHIQNFNNPHKTSFSNIEGYPSTPTNNRFLRDDKTFAEIALKHSQLISPNEDVNVQHLTDSEKAELHTHSNKSVLDTITSVLVSGWNAAATWVSTYGANVLTHIADSSIHVTSTLLSTINNKVDKVEGKGLSTNDFTNEQKELLSQQSGVNTGDQNLSGLEPKRGADDFYITSAEKTQGALATGNTVLPTVKSTSNEAFKNSVTKLSISTGKNLFNKNAKGIIDGKYLSSMGSLFYNASYFISDYIYVEPTTVYTHSNFNMGGAFGCIYTEAGLFISSFNSSSITIPANGRYIRLSGTISTKNTQQVEVGSISTIYEPYIEYLPLSSLNDQLTVFDNKKISKQLSKNLLNPYDNNIIIGKYFKPDGNLGTNANYSISGYIYIQGLQNIAINYGLAGAFIVFYTKYKAYISSSGSGATWAVPSNAYYVRVSGPSLDQTIWQVESGTSFTTFEKYSEYTPLLQVQNQAYDRLVDIVLPANLYFVKDNQSCIYYENVLRKNLNDSISLYLSKGINYNRLCAFKFSTPASNQTMTAITIQALKKLNSKSITYNVVDPSANNGKTINVLHIGDSFTDIGTWVKETKTLLNAQGITYNLVGTCGDSTFRAEGLSGGTLANTFLNTSAGVGKRVQVTGVTTLPSTSYPGRTYRDSNGKDWTIRSGKVDGSGNGYLVVTKFGATETDFVNFPASGILTKQGSGEGDEIINYINPTFCYFNPFINPISGQLDINNYITTWGLLTPNIIVIQFTWNDIGVWATDSSLNNVVANFKTSVDHIHISLPSAKVVLSIEPFGSVNGNLDFNGKKYSVLRFAELMIAQFENNASYSNWVKIAPSYAFVDLVYGYSANTVIPCKRYALTEQSGGDGTHPSEIGMKQIADCISQIIANII